MYHLPGAMPSNIALESKPSLVGYKHNGDTFLLFSLQMNVLTCINQCSPREILMENLQSLYPKRMIRIDLTVITIYMYVLLLKCCSKDRSLISEAEVYAKPNFDLNLSFLNSVSYYTLTIGLGFFVFVFIYF